MAKEKAKEFLEHVMKNPELKEKMKGFTLQDLRDAHEDLLNEGAIEEENRIIPHLTW
jgi:hypothetical protein